MKYPLNEYLENDFYFGEEDIQNHQQKVVKVRKPHTCCNCQKEIHKGENALYESGFMDGQPVSCYTCIPCCDAMLDEILEEDEEVE